MQQRLFDTNEKRRSPDKIQINYSVNGAQRIKLSEGCPHLCPYCYEGNQMVQWPIPEITSNNVEILDMNFLYQPEILQRLKILSEKTYKEKVVYFEAVCGFDFRLLTQDIANALKVARFQHPKLAWDWFMKDQYKINDAIEMLLKAGYKSGGGRTSDISIFMLVNWKIPYEECCKKLDLMKVWRVNVCDCCYDGGYKYATPMHWKAWQIESFRAKCRKHNQLVAFGIDPEIK
jgi:hypothetical protein